MINTVAVIGSGMAGLAAARRCRQSGYDVTVFEACSGRGMDSHAMHVHNGIVDVPLRVMSPEHWCSVLTLAKEVQVDTFAVNTYVSCSDTDGHSWFTSGRMPLTGWPFVGSWRYLRPPTLTIAAGIRQLAAIDVERLLQNPHITLQQVLAEQRFESRFWRGLILPLLTTICTCDEEHLLNWPAGQLLALLQQIMHGEQLLRLQGGTSALVDALAQGLTSFSGSPVTQVKEQEHGVLVVNDRHEGGVYDRVIIATQANQLNFLQGESYDGEKAVLAAVRYDHGELCVHSDPRFMPRRRNDWKALNFQSGNDLNDVMFTVWVNAVEPSLHGKAPVFQTWNPLYPIREDALLARVPLQRAVVHSGTAAVLEALNRWHQQPGRRVFYSGSWAHEGVPLLESAVRASERVVDILRQQQRVAES
ncbi:MAG: monoamine oxidase [Gammaproteobacteria bacterium HGW-Gammaproteobacteria-14]|nr:MAG: monoamine oxidase [Gammaproteobacteria bacterium HGW-Gammaproteobacteria-14]